MPSIHSQAERHRIHEKYDLTFKLIDMYLTLEPVLATETAHEQLLLLEDASEATKRLGGQLVSRQAVAVLLAPYLEL